jgi:hypothetical protein
VAHGSGLLLRVCSGARLGVCGAPDQPNPRSHKHEADRAQQT